ncbi:MAG: MFS transporter [Chloroflexi bacterium]|uniref:MFS transporter n=1 Tax=Candidatus Chlorohelix allophototropha TaxID=3003348 RepID=A0A8T7M2K4_9CHLR|nr:MFS transporter [Chloroflexota bacterium]WJW66554.1 MFS transporter [Chloroflexota bacterium L227-S17]
MVIAKRNKFLVGLVFFLVLMFQVASGFSAGIISSILDPVMINELGVPAILVGVLLGSHYFIEPIRSYIGSLSDRYSIFKMHRAPFIAIGGITLAGSYPLILLVVQQLRDPNFHRITGEVANTGNYQSNFFWVIVAILVFLINGTGISIMGTAALAVLVDTTSERVRGFLASIGWTLLIAGIIISSIVGRVILPENEGRSFDYNSLYPIFLFLFPAILLVLVFLSVIGTSMIEPRREGAIDHKRTHVNFRQAFKVVTSIRQARVFLSFLFVYCAFTFMRDILAPAYAGNVYRMTVAERSAIQATLNGPILVAMIGAGVVTLWINKRYSIYGGLGVAVIGMLLQAVSGFIFKVDQAAIQAYDAANNAHASGLISEDAYAAARKAWDAAIAGDKSIFTIGLIIMGLGLGTSVPGLIGTMMDITDKANAALYIGVWGIAQAFGTGLANLGAGALRDFAFNAFPNNLSVGYGFVFLTQAIGTALALALFTRVSVPQFQKEIAEITAAIHPEEAIAVASGTNAGGVA